jgi:hypothetical protein
MPRRRNAAPRSARRRRRPPPPRPKARPAARATEAERRLLALARELGGFGGDPLPRALRALAAAYAPDAPLPRAVARAFVASRDDKTAALALAYAREQVRLALQESVEVTPPSSRGRLSAPSETLAWLLLAGAEALALEPPSAVADRVRALAALIGLPPPP